MTIGIQIDELIQNKVHEICKNKKVPEFCDIIKTDNIGEVIEKLCILHVRTWMLEDLAGTTDNDKDFVSVRRKIEFCYKQKRPVFIEAINKLIDESIISGKQLYEENVKLYKTKG